MKFEEARKGEHFFRSTLVQTLFYGVFSAWVLWQQEASPHRPQGPLSTGARPPGLCTCP